MADKELIIEMDGIALSADPSDPGVQDIIDAIKAALKDCKIKADDSELVVTLGDALKGTNN